MDLVSMGMTVNSQALINMSKVRLCWCADKDARKVMFEIVKQNKECGYSKEFLRNWRIEYLNGREQLL